MELPEVMPGHWDTPEGAEMASRSLGERREQLTKGNLSDLALANAQFLVSRDSLELIHYQTAAKERLRWLSAHLALAYVALEAVSAIRSTNWKDGDDPEMQAAFEAVDAVLAGRSK